MVRNRKESGKHLKTKWLQKTELRWNHKKKLIWGMWRGSGDNDGSLRNWEKRWRDRDFRYLFYLLWDYGSKCHYKKNTSKMNIIDIFSYIFIYLIKILKEPGFCILEQLRLFSAHTVNDFCAFFKVSSFSVISFKNIKYFPFVTPVLYFIFSVV